MKIFPKKTSFFIFCILICFSLITPLSAGELFLSELDILTRGLWQNERLNLKSSGGFSLELSGGYKVAASLRLKLESDDLFDPLSGNPIQFQYISLGIRDLFNLPVQMDYFIGEGDYFGSGKGFSKKFGTEPFASRFPERASRDIAYKGLFRINGTGLFVSTDFGGELARLEVYTYQDSSLAPWGVFTSAVHGLWNWEQFRLEAYASASYPSSQAGLYSGGLLFYYRPGKAGEFFVQAGIPRWDPANDSFSADLFYFLFETRLHGGIFSFIPTFFLRPAYYLNEATDEEGVMDINLNFMLGNTRVTPLSGGIDTTMTLSPDGGASGTDEFFRLTLSPYIGALTAGISWDFRLNFHILKNSADPFFETEIGIKAEF